MRSLPRVDCRGLRRPGKGLKLSASGNGYLFFVAHKDRKKKIIYVHTLVALIHHGPRPEGYQINHKDGDKSNNHPENLEYVTPSENRLHSHRVLRQNLGDSHHNAKLTASKVRWIRKNIGVISQRVMAQELKVNPATVADVVARRTWKHLEEE